MNKISQEEMDKQEARKKETITKGRSWFEYVRKDFEEMTSPLDSGEDCFFLIIGLLGELADFDEDDVDLDDGEDEDEDDWKGDGE